MHACEIPSPPFAHPPSIRMLSELKSPNIESEGRGGDKEGRLIGERREGFWSAVCMRFVWVTVFSGLRSIPRDACGDPSITEKGGNVASRANSTHVRVEREKKKGREKNAARDGRNWNELSIAAPVNYERDIIFSGCEAGRGGGCSLPL